MDLQPQLTLLRLQQLGSFRDSQIKTEGKIKSLINEANIQMAEVDRQFQSFLGGATRTVGNTPITVMDSRTHAPLMAQKVDRQSKIRQQFGVDLRPLEKQVLANVALAKTYSTRHWSKPKPLVLNRATTGLASGVGLTDALMRKAAYGELFKLAGKAELFAWAQLAIDTGDAVLADAVLRANGKRPRDERAFLASTFLNLIPNADYNEARTILEAVLASARSAGIAIAEFEGRRSAVSLELIRMGLTDQDGELPTDGLDDDPFDSSGAVKPEYLMNAGKKVAEQAK